MNASVSTVGAVKASTRHTACVFCDAQAGRKREIVLENRHFAAIFDKYPVNAGHTLLFPKRHVESLFELTAREWSDFRRLLTATKTAVDTRFRPQGYNLGVNCGPVAGQTIPHLHIHVIPRYEGDVQNPRGGVRNLKQPLVKYP